MVIKGKILVRGGQGEKEARGPCLVEQADDEIFQYLCNGLLRCPGLKDVEMSVIQKSVEGFIGALRRRAEAGLKK